MKKIVVMSVCTLVGFAAPASAEVCDFYLGGPVVHCLNHRVATLCDANNRIIEYIPRCVDEKNGRPNPPRVTPAPIIPDPVDPVILPPPFDIGAPGDGIDDSAPWSCGDVSFDGDPFVNARCTIGDTSSQQCSWASMGWVDNQGRPSQGSTTVTCQCVAGTYAPSLWQCSFTSGW